MPSILQALNNHFARWVGLQKDRFSWLNMKVAVVLRGLKDAFDFVVGAVWIAAVPSIFMGLYTYLIVYVMVLTASWGWGPFVWIVPFAMLGPVVIVWLRVLYKRYRDYLASICGETPLRWDIEALVESWLKLTERKEQKAKG